MAKDAAAGRFFKQGRLLNAAVIIITGILLVPPVIVFCDHDQAFFRFNFLAAESGICAFGLIAAIVICRIIEGKKPKSSPKLIGPGELLRPLRHSSHNSITAGFGAVACVSFAAAIIVYPDYDGAVWLGIPAFSWFALLFGIAATAAMIVVIIRNNRAMSRVMEGAYSVYLAEFTRGDSDKDPDSHLYYMYFEKAGDTRPRMFTTDYGTYAAAKPGDMYYLLVVGRDIVNALRADEHILSEEFEKRLIKEQPGEICC